MNEWTEQEEQQIIERAKAGDPEANYALSLWALQRAEEEPDEPRWNRLAAKCLVKSAQAGYGPAKEQMAALLNQSSPAPAQGRHSAPAADPEPQPQPRRRPAAFEQDADDVDDSDVKRAAPIRRSAPQRPGSIRRSAAAARTEPAARRPAGRRQRPLDEEDEGFDVDDASWDDGYDEDEDDYPARRGPDLGGLLASLRSGLRGGRSWGDDKWRRLEIICVAVCAVLLIVIAVLIISGKRGGDSGGNGGSSIPPAGEVGATGDGVTAVSTYPDEATKAAIMAADLDIFPAQEDYETEPTTGTVSVSSEYLRVRKGPNTTYDPVAQLPNGTTVSVFAKKNDWDLILYQSAEGPVYGWCSSGYLIITAGSAGTAAAAPATDAPGSVIG